MTTRSSAKNLFVYGSLTSSSLFQQIAGKQLPISPAVLKDFQKFTSRLGYPYILPRKGSVVKGLLIRGIDPETIKRLDRYEAEGRLYFRRRVNVVSQGRRVGCETYVGNPRRL